MANTINLTRKTLVLAAMETTYGTEQSTIYATANVSSHAMLLFDEINPLGIDTQVVDKQVIRASLTKNANLIGRRLYTFKPKTMAMCSPGYVNGSSASCGTPPGYGLPPFFGTLLRACGLQEDLTAGAGASGSVIYKPRSSGFESATCHVLADQIKHVLVGTVGTFSAEGRGGEGIEFSFDMKSKYTQPYYSSTVPSPTYPADNKVLVQSEGLTVSEFTTETPIVRSFKFDAGVNIIERRDMNSAFGLYGLYVTDRKPTLELVIEVESNLANFDPFDDLGNASTGAITSHLVKFIHGTSNPNKFGFCFRSAQLKDVQYQDDSGIRTYALSYDLVSSTDDYEYAIRTSGALTAGINV